jgi:hypothetical protein
MIIGDRMNHKVSIDDFCPLREIVMPIRQSAN